jgi:hypothetical protein
LLNSEPLELLVVLLAPFIFEEPIEPHLLLFLGRLLLFNDIFAFLQTHPLHLNLLSHILRFQGVGIFDLVIKSASDVFNVSLLLDKAKQHAFFRFFRSKSCLTLTTPGFFALSALLMILLHLLFKHALHPMLLLLLLQC